MTRHHTVSFLSDYGTADEFVGVVASVIRTIAPHARVIDITHGVPAHDVRSGGLTLARSVQYLAPGVVLAVVDPGVATARRAIAVEVGGDDSRAYFVGPDNGLLAGGVAMAGGASRAVELTNPTYQLEAPGPTFAGRDVFAPAAAHLCNGVELADLGDLVDPETLRPGILPLPREEAGGIVAEALWVDRFGNAQLNVGPDEIDAWGDRITVTIGNRKTVAVRAVAYEDIVPGAVGVVVDSYGMVSLAVARGSAAEQLNIHPADSVRLDPPT